MSNYFIKNTVTDDLGKDYEYKNRMLPIDFGVSLYIIKPKADLEAKSIGLLIFGSAGYYKTFINKFDKTNLVDINSSETNFAYSIGVDLLVKLNAPLHFRFCATFVGETKFWSGSIFIPIKFF